METQTATTQANLTPAEALIRLQEGNARFVTNRQANRDLMQQVETTSEGQYPFAVVLGCVDSRVSPELLFDQGVGDIFSARIAGNFVNEDILGSMEFACKVAGSKLILVLGHSKCGAIMETSWPAATMVLRILLRYASTKKNVSPSNFKQHYSRLTRSL